MLVISGSFQSVLRAAQAEGLLQHAAPRPDFDMRYSLDRDWARMKEIEDWCSDNFGPEAIASVRSAINETEWDWNFMLTEGKWVHYGGHYYFTDIEDAVAFVLQFSGE